MSGRGKSLLCLGVGSGQRKKKNDTRRSDVRVDLAGFALRFKNGMRAIEHVPQRRMLGTDTAELNAVKDTFREGHIWRRAHLEKDTFREGTYGHCDPGSRFRSRKGGIVDL